MFVTNAELIAATGGPVPTMNVPNPSCCSVPGHLCDNCRNMVVPDDVDLPLPPPSCDFNYGLSGAEIIENAKAEGSNADANEPGAIRAGRGGLVPQSESKAYWDPTSRKGKYEGEDDEPDDDLEFVEEENRLRLRFGQDREFDVFIRPVNDPKGVREERTTKLVRQT